MTYINLSRHDARLGGDLRSRLAKHPLFENAGTLLVYTN